MSIGHGYIGEVSTQFLGEVSTQVLWRSVFASPLEKCLLKSFAIFYGVIYFAWICSHDPV